MLNCQISRTASLHVLYNALLIQIFSHMFCLNDVCFFCWWLILYSAYLKVTPGFASTSLKMLGQWTENVCKGVSSFVHSIHYYSTYLNSACSKLQLTKERISLLLQARHLNFWISYWKYYHILIFQKVLFHMASHHSKLQRSGDVFKKRVKILSNEKIYVLLSLSLPAHAK